MKRRMGEVLGLVLSVALLYIPGSAAASIIVGFDPATSDNVVADIFSVDLVVTVDQGDSIVSFGLDVLFDATILNTVIASVNPSIFVGSIVDIANDGVIDLTGFAAFPLSGELTLATLVFEAEMEGMTSLDAAFPGFPVTDGFGLPFPPGGTVLPDTVEGAMVTVGPEIAAPEPSTTVLMMFALVWLVAARRIKENAVREGSRKEALMCVV